MNLSVRKFVEIVASVHQVGPILEGGSMRVRGQEGMNLRDFFPQLPYYGYDLNPGLGVDLIANALEVPFGEDTFGTVLLCEMLEHCRQPALAVSNAVNVLKDNGVAIVTVPFCISIHHVPDYWRFSPMGLEVLLEGVLKHFAIYFKGDPQLPYGLFSFGTQDEETFRRIEKALETRLGEMPTIMNNSCIYRWLGIDNYLRAIAKIDPNRMPKIAEFFDHWI